MVIVRCEGVGLRGTFGVTRVCIGIMLAIWLVAARDAASETVVHARIDRDLAEYQVNRDLSYTRTETVDATLYTELALRQLDRAEQTFYPDKQALLSLIHIFAFYDHSAFPPEYRGDAFVTLHGSWNRSKRTGYKVIRVHFANGRPTGEYEDFLIGFVRSDRAVWGRPVGVTVAADGALLVSEDGNGTIWRVVYTGDAKH